MAALTVAAALARILDRVEPLGPETVALLDAPGRVLASDVAARLTQPPFTASAMDGYAVRAADVARLPAELAVTGESAAGSGYHGALQAGEAVRILTGAPLPPGADAIVIQENADRSGPKLVVREGSPDAAHIRPTGGDFRVGETVLRAGELLNARSLSLAAAAGHGTLAVRRKPKVAILATGDELVPPGELPGRDHIVSSNPVGLAAMVKAFGGDPVMLGIAPDNLADTVERLQAASRADVVVTTGGASVGDHDLVRPSLESLGMTLAFWKLAMRPGKPMLYGRLGAQRVLGLPGNPVSALITARVFLVPLIAALLGRAEGGGDEVWAEVAVDLPANGVRQHYMRASVERGEGGRVTVRPFGDQDSSLLMPLMAANALLVRPVAAPAVAKGTRVPVLMIDF